jgi:Domain of unknown function (DUF4382)
MIRKLTVSLFGLAILVGLGSCNTGSSNGGPAGVQVYLTDAPLDLAAVTAVNVSIRDVKLYPTSVGDGDAGGMSLESGPISLPGDMTINLLDFQNGQTTLLGSASVPAGSYDRIRLEIDSAELVRDDDGDPMTPDVVEPIGVPSGKVDVPVRFQLTQDESLQITLDFNAQASVQVNSTNGGANAYLLRPVVTPVGMQTSGK